MSLLQAEAVDEVVKAQSIEERQIAADSLYGKKRDRLVQDIRDSILDLMVKVEVGLDFEEIVLEDTFVQSIEQQARTLVKQIQKEVEETLNNIEQINRSKVAIVGPPNVGKSSLMNFLTGKETSIVSEIQGTTRDVVREFISYKGRRLEVLDTAGIRQTCDPIEILGVQKSKQFCLTRKNHAKLCSSHSDV